MCTVGGGVRLGGDQLIHSADAAKSAERFRMRRGDDVEEVHLVACASGGTLIRRGMSAAAMWLSRCPAAVPA